MKVYVEKEDRLLELDAKAVDEILSRLGINPQTVIIVKNNQVVLEDEELEAHDEIKILSVISGG